MTFTCSQNSKQFLGRNRFENDEERKETVTAYQN